MAFGDFRTPAELLAERQRKFDQLDSLSRAFRSFPAAQLQAAMSAALPADRFVAYFGGDTFRTLREKSERHQLLLRDLGPLISPESIIARQKAAMAIAEALPDFSVRMDRLAEAMRPTLATASDAMTAYSRAIQGLPGVSAFDDPAMNFQALAQTLGAQLAEVGRSIQAARTAEGLTAGGDPADDEDGWLEAIAEQTSRAETAWAAASVSEDTGERFRHLGELLDIFAAILAHLGTNTLTDIRKASIVRLLEIVVLVAAVYEIAVPDPPRPLAKEDRQALEGARRDISGLSRQLVEIEAAEEEAERRFLEPLARARIRADANVRAEPRGGGTRLHRLASGETVAVTGKQGRWRQIVYRDALTGRLSQGWVYSTSVEPL